MIRLPIDDVLPEITAKLRHATALVVVAPPGAGKTTRVPPALLAAGILPPNQALVMLQPRRVAARAAAARIASEQGWRLGEQVGYHVRFEKVLGPHTALRVVTEGILGRQLLEDPYLEGIGCVVLDEFHERSVHTDLAIAMLRELQQTVRPDLKIVVMSATLEAEPVAAYLGADTPIVRSEGRLFSVALEHRPPGDAKLVDHVARAVLDEARTAVGDLLVFLPGVEEIRRVKRSVEPALASAGHLVVELHGSLSFEDQKRALEPAPAGQRKIILATNIAETSLTIEGVRTVIDSGVARVAGFDPERGLDKLELARISKASAAQRAGRAGRTAPGRCVRLWSLQQERHLADFELPEIQRVDLCQTVLALHAWGATDARRFGWYEPPPEAMVGHAEDLLAMLGAVKAGKITPLGQRMLRLPVHPRLGRLLVAAAEMGLKHEGALVAALLAEKDILRVTGPGAGPMTVADSDLIVRMQLVEEVRRSGFASFWRDRGVDVHAVRQVLRASEELARVAGHAASASPANTPPADERLLRLPLWAYPDRVVRRRGDGPTGVMVGGSGVRIAAESAVAKAEFLVALDARQDQRSTAREALVRVASAIEPAWLEEMFPDQLRQEDGVEIDESRGRVSAVHRVYYRDLLIREDRHGAVDPEQAGAALAQWLGPRAREWFERDEKAANWLARLELARRAMPERPWPVLDDAALAELLAGACVGKRSADEVRGESLLGLLRSTLAYPLDRVLDEQVPEALDVPSGSRIRLDYTPVRSGQAPVLAVRLQEMFGQVDTPRICQGRTKVVLHLLGPNYRPVQITDDLASFWRNAYFEVRKDLRVRYPRHAWPEDPLHAKPEAKGGRKRA